MVRVIFLFLTRFYVNDARRNGNPTWCAFHKGHLYEVFRVLAETRLI